MLLGMRKLGIFCLAIALVTLAQIDPVEARRYSAIVIDADTGEVLHENGADLRNYPASLTKIMTLYMVFDAIKTGKLSEKERLKVSRKATRQPPSRLGLRRKDTISVEDAILALVTKSANDVAVVVAERLGGTEARFARAMTAKAHALGMKNTTFRNASGLPNRSQKSTARDMALLGKRLLEDFPDQYKYFATRTFTYKGQRFGNHNKLLRGYKGTDGIKTGFINASGFNLVASVKRHGRRLIGVVYGGRTGKSRDAQMKKLLERSFRRMDMASIRPVLRPSDRPQLLLAKNETEMKEAVNPNPFENEEEKKKSDREALLDLVASIQSNTVDLAVAQQLKKAEEARKQGNWAIQVGAFKAHSRAKKMAKTAASKLGNFASAATVAVAKGGRNKNLYKARLVGFTKEDARNSCKRLKNHDIACIPLQMKNISASKPTTSRQENY